MPQDRTITEADFIFTDTEMEDRFNRLATPPPRSHWRPMADQATALAVERARANGTILKKHSSAAKFEMAAMGADIFMQDDLGTAQRQYGAGQTVLWCGRMTPAQAVPEEALIRDIHAARIALLQAQTRFEITVRAAACAGRSTEDISRDSGEDIETVERITSGRPLRLPTQFKRFERSTEPGT